MLLKCNKTRSQLFVLNSQLDSCEVISASAEDFFDASVDKLVESPGFHPGVFLPVQVRPEVPMVE